MLTNIENKSDFVVNLSRHSRCGILQLPIDTLDIRRQDGILWFHSDSHNTVEGYNQYDEVCINPLDLVWSCFYNGKRSILTCTCGEDGCAGFDTQYVYCLAGYVYWLVMVNGGEVFVFRYLLDEYRQRVKELINELRDYYQSTQDQEDNRGERLNWYPCLEQLNELCQMFDENTNLESIYNEDERTAYWLFYKYGKNTDNYIISPSYVHAEPKSSPRLEIMIGIPASGKSTYCSGYYNYANVISLDKVKTRGNEQLLIDDALWQRANIVIDNTNVTREERARYIDIAKRHGYRVEGYFFQSILSDCIQRNEKRDQAARIPTKAIVAMSNQLELPSRNEGFDELYFMKIDNGYFNKTEWKED